MLVYIVYAPTADMLGPDVERMNRVEEMPDEVGRMWIAGGSARVPTAEELAAYEEQRQVEAKAGEAEDLTTLRKDDLVALAEQRGVDISGAKTKADIAAALERHSQQEPADGAAQTNPDGAVAEEHVAQPTLVTDEQGDTTSTAPVE